MSSTTRPQAEFRPRRVNERYKLIFNISRYSSCGLAEEYSAEEQQPILAYRAIREEKTLFYTEDITALADKLA